MGQQQLLFLILATFLIILAIAVGIQAFHNWTIKANEEAVYHDILTMVAKIESCFGKSTLLGGVANSSTLIDIKSFHQLGYYEYNDKGNIIIPDKTFNNENASYKLIPGDTLVIEALPAEKPERRILCRCAFSPADKKVVYTLEQVSSTE